MKIHLNHPLFLPFTFGMISLLMTGCRLLSHPPEKEVQQAKDPLCVSEKEIKEAQDMGIEGAAFKRALKETAPQVETLCQKMKKASERIHQDIQEDLKKNPQLEKEPGFDRDPFSLHAPSLKNEKGDPSGKSKAWKPLTSQKEGVKS